METITLPIKCSTKRKIIELILSPLPLVKWGCAVIGMSLCLAGGFLLPQIKDAPAFIIALGFEFGLIGLWLIPWTFECIHDERGD